MKTAGTSMEVVLSELCEDGDVLSPLGEAEDEALREKVTGRKPANYHYSFRDWLRLGKKEKVLAAFTDYYRSKYTEHMAAARVRKVIGEEVWNSYFKFTIVRNPYDRFVSRYYFDMYKMYQEPNKRELARLNWGIQSPDEFIRYRPERVNENWRLYSDRDRCLVDKAVRYEYLEEDLHELSAAIGLDGNLHDRMKAIRTKSHIRPKSKSRANDLLGPEEKLSVYLLCRREFELFGYDPGDEVRELLAGETPAPVRRSA